MKEKILALKSKPATDASNHVAMCEILQDMESRMELMERSTVESLDLIANEVDQLQERVSE